MEPRTFHTPNGLQLEVRIPAGTIDVRCEDTDETRLEIDGERDADELRIELIEVSAGGHRLLVEHRNRKRFNLLGSNELAVRVTAPTGAGVVAETGAADLAVSGRTGPLTFRTGSGDLSFDIVGDVEAKVASGDVRGEHVAGDLTVHSASGDLSAARVDGSVTARTASGDIRVEVVGGAVNTSTASGDVEIGSVAAGETQVRTVSGDITVGVARGARVWLDLGSTSGETVSELDAADVPDEGGPVLELRASSVSGDIRVRRGASHARTEP